MLNDAEHPEKMGETVKRIDASRVRQIGKSGMVTRPSICNEKRQVVLRPSFSFAQHTRQ